MAIRLLLIAIAALGLASPAAAQFDTSFQFLAADSAGGAPHTYEYVKRKVDASKARGPVKKTGVVVAKGQDIPGTFQSRKSSFLILTGISDARGRTVLPVAYNYAIMLSERVALVRRVDGVTGLLDIKTKALKPIAEDVLWQTAVQGMDAPARLLMGEKQANGLYSYCIVSPLGECGPRISDIAAPASGNAYNTGVVFYPEFLIANHVDAIGRYSATYDWNGETVVERAPPFLPLMRAKDGGGFAFNSILFELPLPTRRIGGISTKLYWPMDNDGRMAEMPDDFVGMYPFDRSDAEFSKGVWSGMVVLRRTNGTEQLYLGNRVAVNGRDYHDPYSLASNSALLHGPYLDIWFNTSRPDWNSSYDVALLKPDTGKWVPAIGVGSTYKINDILSRAGRSKISADDPRLAIDLQLQANKQITDQWAAESRRRYERGKDALARLVKLPQTFQADRNSCGIFYGHAKGNSNPDWVLFTRAYDNLYDTACKHVPRSIYADMQARGFISPYTPPANSAPSFSDTMDAWMDEMKRRKRENESGSSRYRCFTYVNTYCIERD